jgi:hypothetical protein
MTGVAAQWCGAAPAEYQSKIEGEWKRSGRNKPQWGARRVVLNDLAPAATFITANYNLRAQSDAFLEEANSLMSELENELGWMYETIDEEGRIGQIEYFVWSEVFSCPECASDIVFTEEAMDSSGKIKDEFACPRCDTLVSKKTLERSFDRVIDPALGVPRNQLRLRPHLKIYTIDDERWEAPVTDHDLAVLRRIDALPFPAHLPVAELPIGTMTHGSRLAPKGVTHVHHLYLRRPAHSLAFLWERTARIADTRIKNAMRFFVEQAFWTMSILNSYRPTGFSQVSQYLKGVFYIPSQHAEVSPWYVLGGKSKKLGKFFSNGFAVEGAAIVTTGDCSAIGLPDESVDYIFTDPPFGENIPYSDLNFVVEAWHRVFTSPAQEAVIDRPKSKGLNEYQDLMRRCFEEYHRLLKPGRWMTVVFSNSSNAVWRAIQEAMGTAGFIVADVRTLDKQQGSFRQVTSTAVKQDLVISAYKPTEALTRKLELGASSTEGAWAFVSEHLKNAAQPTILGDEVQIIAERTAQMLHDRMVAVHVQRGLAVPMDTAEFLAGVSARFPSRDGMYFMPEQAAAYDRARSRAKGVGQLDFFVQDEATAIQWARQRLTIKPQSFSDLQPQFMKELRNWPKHERSLELRDLLRDNFLEYDGDGEVPPQIHDYLSTQYHDLRGLSKTDPKLVAKARGRWYVPNPAKQADLDKLRVRALLKEFDEYTQSGTAKLKSFRTEAVRAGFKAAYDRRNWDLIVRIARRLPETVLQEDEKLLMYYDVAATRLGDEE